MNTLESILIAILFFIPGFIVKKMQERFFPRTRKESGEFDKTISAIFFSLIIIFINLLIISIRFENDSIETIEQLQNKLMNIDFLIYYISITLIVSVSVMLLNQYILEPITLTIYNKYRDLSNRPRETEFETVWDEIFENPKINMDDTYISIEKNGVMISQGLLASYSSPNPDNKELLLICSNEFKAHLDNDERLKNEGKEPLFDKIDKEYYNLQTDVLIKFYNMDKFNEYAISYQE